MKKTLYYIILQIIFGIQIVSGENLYYWYQGSPKPLTTGEHYFVLSSNNNSLSWQISPQLQRGTDIYYQSPTYKYNGQETYISNKFYVKLFDYSDTLYLHSLANEKNVDILREVTFAPKTYVLACSNTSAGNALQMANYFYETNRFEYSEPEFLLLEKYCANDYYYSNQWNLENSSDVDINFCGAKSITQGNNTITIAIVDDGVYEGHSDLMVSNKFTIDNNNFYSSDYQYGKHGTNCAGIINARTNTNGISGIAPGCSLLSAAVATPSSESYYYAIYYATNYHNADVILCSWGSSDAINSLLPDAIYNALANGRNGLGTVVVWASGNHYSYESYGNEQIKSPADIYDDILVVGAIKQNGKRQTLTNGNSGWSSCYGNKLDVVAPGVNVPTTSYTTQYGFDNESYDMNFSGTSAAAAHVAAIAGLILSMNPLLTNVQVNNIIERTAQKLSSYNFSSNSSHPNGSWNIEVGHGLVDASLALQELFPTKYIQNQVYPTNTLKVISADTIIAGNHVTNTLPHGDVVLQNGSNVTFMATKSIELHPGFRVEHGAIFRATIGSPSQQSSAPSNIRKRGTTKEEHVNISVCERQEKKSLNIFPNPVQNILNVQVNDEPSHIMIYNSKGQLVLQTSQTDIDVSSLSKGMYILRAVTSNGQEHQAKFIKD